MKAGISVRNSYASRFGVRLLIACLFLVGLLGCAPVATQPVPRDVPSSVPTETIPTVTIPTATIPTVPTLPAGWQTDTPQQQCGYSISHPAEMQGSSGDAYSWMIRTAVTDPDQAARNFIYVTAVPKDFQSGTELAYNYDPAGADLLLKLQVGEAKSVHPSPDLAPWFTFRRTADVTIGDQVVQAYENAQPWEFPPGTKEIRYYLKTNDCIYQFGGYMDTTGSTQPGAISQDLFNQIVLTFQGKP